MPDPSSSDLILHHYATSPFSEKVRLMLGYKGLAWRSVTVPIINPKPDVIALTGGYRKTPFMQVGADIYCDTALIAQLLETRAPQPSLYPADAPLAPQLAQWADSTLFWTMIPYVMQPAGAAAIFAGTPPEVLKAFAADRAGFTTGMRRRTLADATVQLKAALASLNAQLGAQQAIGRPGLLGASLSIADFSVAHCLWFIRRAAPVAGILAAYPQAGRLLDQVLELGHGHKQAFDSTQAMALAAAATAHATTTVVPGQGFDAGAAVTVSATDYGMDPVAGTLVGLTDDEVVIRRADERAGILHVHFPRAGFQIKPEKTA